jgi:AAA15 family ATPase/GTPase
MGKYYKLLNEFRVFVEAAKDSLGEFERKLLNLILNHFDEIVEIGIAHRKRATLLNELVQREGQNISAELVSPGNTTQGKAFSFTALTSLTVENFRGFSKEEVIPFDKRYTFIYGPNGSGKSSLCEALEYSMLGYINEAISKRIDVNQYIKNAMTGKVSLPKLAGISPEGSPIKIAENASLHQFCFIGKNRIENFARISANTPNEKKTLLATLFGLDEFNEFVGNFTYNIEKYIDTNGIKSEELRKKSEVLSVHKENISKETNKIISMASESQQLVDEANLKMPFAAFDTYIHGDESKKGRLAELDELMNRPIGQVCIVTSIASLDAAFNETDKIVESFQELNAQYLRNKDKFNFRNLYRATVELEILSKDKCPVCETPVDASVKHPYDNARTKLEELSEIASIEQRRENAFRELRTKLLLISQILSQFTHVAKQLSLSLSIPEYIPSIIETIVAYDTLIGGYQNNKAECEAHRDELVRFDDAVSKHNAAILEQEKQRTSLQTEREKLQNLSRSITDLKARQKAAKGNLDNWEKNIFNFNAENAQLIKDVEEEVKVLEINRAYVKAYYNLLGYLEGYKNQLPVKHLEKLNSLTLVLYNTINMHDRVFEKAARIELPASTDDTIKISFMDAPEITHDALHILSEGHLRCLGLAILLAKNIHDGCPVVIFDDVVNAIDDDHKGGVREVIFNHEEVGLK